MCQKLLKMGNSSSSYRRRTQCRIAGYPMVKNFEDMFIRFDRIHERDR